jgi:hypothetical protein
MLDNSVKVETDPNGTKYITLYFTTNGSKKTDFNIYFTPEEVSYWKEHQLEDDWMIENKINSIINRLRAHEAENETDTEINEYYNNWYKDLAAPALAELHRIYRNQLDEKAGFLSMEQKNER